MRLNQVTVSSGDLDAAERFYRLLGLELIVRADGYLRFVCPDGGSTFSVEFVAGTVAPGSTTVYFESDELDAEHARLTAAGVAFEHPPQDMAWRWREARLRDPDGNRLCLFHAGEDRRDPPWRIRG